MEKEVIDTFTVLNGKGLHARPSAEIVKCTSSFRSRFTLELDGMCANGKSILDILALGATCGSRVVVKVVGVDAEEAMNSLREAIKRTNNYGSSEGPAKFEDLSEGSILSQFDVFSRLDLKEESEKQIRDV